MFVDVTILKKNGLGTSILAAAALRVHLGSVDPKPGSKRQISYPIRAIRLRISIEAARRAKPVRK
jgi:hypothetical protein